MMDRRVSAENAAQPAISSSVRPQPRQSPDAASMLQVWMQGLSIAIKFRLGGKEFIGIAPYGDVRLAAQPRGV
ncbi:hypothetical protein [Jiella pelagia]|uniref:Uncharacterized protein n=1 Tax=Jiella pelagia TaxID=2986949 RepID=A0ABY7C5N3_9HYPH|nr:hypothetical protein [Jiella pelagia]WAP71386.1 hypothetical protein OH818_08680 [Jiella pelagia]